jgi:peptide-methionine (S)-S-oxide reductase
MSLPSVRPKSRRSANRERFAAATVVLVMLGGVCLWAFSSYAEDAQPIPPPALDERTGQQSTETAVLAGGCFWGVQGVFQHVDGVTRAVSGYAGGSKATAEYETVSTGSTGHAESVQITFDPRQISFGRILQIYFSVAHDPTELNRQGPDFGTQYRSAIFPQSEEQDRIAVAYVAQLGQAHAFSSPVVTRIEPGKAFYPAEAYHQNFLTNHPANPYIVINDMPKIASLKRIFPTLYRADPALVAATDLQQ